MRKISIALVSALLASACAAAPEDRTATEQTTSKATVPAPPGSGTIESVSYEGTGCESGTTTTAISEDGQAVTSIFSAFVAAAGGATPAAQAKLNCITMMQVKVPAGWQYSLESIDYRGFAGLGAEVSASRQSLYVISGSPVHVTPLARIKGEFSDNYEHNDVSPEAPGVWSPCGGGQMLWIATQVEVNNGNRAAREGQMTVDSLDTELQWRRCQ
jgi:hypothetical protein